MREVSKVMALKINSWERNASESGFYGGSNLWYYRIPEIAAFRGLSF